MSELPNLPTVTPFPEPNEDGSITVPKKTLEEMATFFMILFSYLEEQLAKCGPEGTNVQMLN